MVLHFQDYVSHLTSVTSGFHTYIYVFVKSLEGRLVCVFVCIFCLWVGWDFLGGGSGIGFKIASS